MASPQTSEYQPGFIIGHRYEVIRRLRRESYGDVWLVHDQLLDVEVGLKILPTDTPQLNRHLEYYRAEAAGGFKLNQPQILGVHHLDETPDCIYLVQEPFEGTTLLALLGSHERLTVPDALYFIEVLGKGLVLAHKQGLIHQNFNPLNVLVSATAGVKIANFAFPPDHPNLEQPEELTAYIPPEVIRGENPTPASNLFSLGVLGYRMLAGILPFPLARGEVFPYQVANGPMELARIPSALQPLFTLSLAENPSKRFQSVAEFLIWLSRSRELLGSEVEYKRGVLETVPPPGGGKEQEQPPALGLETAPAEPLIQAEPEKGQAVKAALAAINLKLTHLYPKLKNISQHIGHKTKELLAQGGDKLRQGWNKLWEFYKGRSLKDKKIIYGLGLGSALVALVLVAYFIILGLTSEVDTLGTPSPSKSVSTSPDPVKSPAARLATAPSSSRQTSRPDQAESATPSKSEAKYRLLVATYKSPKYALRLLRNLDNQGYKAYIRKEPGGKHIFYQVWLASMPTQAQAQAAADSIKAKYGVVPKVVKIKP
ncbi:MAG: protein kinase [Deltaproteobacteria bacterium]|nr:protein kinase [Deltaproteobacteria bacterium]MBW1987146.1 protein kinase [Deltaproteobacteria bacterium]MBW2135358.1 protein kinase [Deltaproteobacteria bacterium]